MVTVLLRGRDRWNMYPTPSGITANLLAPVLFPAGATDVPHTNPDFNAMDSSRASMTLWGDPEELEVPAGCLVSDAWSCMTGYVLVVDGGLTADL